MSTMLLQHCPIFFSPAKKMQCTQENTVKKLLLPLPSFMMKNTKKPP